MKTIEKAWKHFKLISIHKYYVWKNCKVAGLYLQGILHDLSKYTPTEFLESIHYYTGKNSPIDECKKKNGWSAAWMHHKGRNKHHYEFWIDNLDYGGKPIQMPFKYALELVYDYVGAGQAYKKDSFTYQGEYEWWLNKKRLPLAMHPQTKLFVDYLLETMMKENSNQVLNKKRAKKLYNKAVFMLKEE